MSLRLIVDLKDPGECRDSVGLIVPIAPTTEHQCQVEIEIPGADSIDALRSTDEEQSVLLVSAPKSGSMSIAYSIGSGGSGTPKLPACQKEYLNLPPAITVRLHDLLHTASSMVERERRIIDFTAEYFSYGPLASMPIAEQLVCGLASGNCIDINEFLISAMVSCGIPAHYYAGYYFPSRDRPSNADGMHCWISTQIDGKQRYWDVPFSLKRGMKKLRPGLEQLGGAYIAMSIGMELAFDIRGVVYRTRYLAHPSWLLPNGGMQAASVNCRAYPEPSTFADHCNDDNARFTPRIGNGEDCGSL